MPNPTCRVLTIASKGTAYTPENGWTLFLVPHYIDKENSMWRIEKIESSQFSAERKIIGKVELSNGEPNALEHFQIAAARGLDIKADDFNFVLK